MRIRSITPLLVAGLLTAVTTACASNEEPVPGAANAASTTAGPTVEPTTEPTSEPSPLPTASAVPRPTATLPLPPPPPPGGAESVPAEVLDRVRADAAGRLGVAAADVQVVSGQAQEWSDGSLGCPKPGESYIQVLTEGYQVIVGAGGTTLDYRTSTSGAIKVC